MSSDIHVCCVGVSSDNYTLERVKRALGDCVCVSVFREILGLHLVFLNRLFT